MICRNVGTIDRVIRLIVGLALISIVFFGPQTPWGWLGLIPLISGVLGTCPTYRLFGFSSCATKN